MMGVIIEAEATAGNFAWEQLDCLGMGGVFFFSPW